MKQNSQILLSFFITAMLSSCANLEPNDGRNIPTDSEVEQYNASVEPDERIVCRQEIPASSHIPRRMCRYVRDVAETSSFHRSELYRILR